ncbi:S8 family serine peptidase [Dactylosporangium sp. CA-092794]|uniref:S8 family serine peptidase n=1 Tax=Dactylosporangium sp. CA-092794 TaxID=3239929 RepID=UPI003D8B3683
MSRTVRLILAVAVCLTVIGAPAAATAAEGGYVKYYTVAKSYNGAAENLTEIAKRFLGDGDRSAEVFSLNVGRKQPDGASLSDPAQLHAGWYLVLPWDAIGDGIAYGILPTTAPKPSTSTPSPKNTPTKSAATAPAKTATTAVPNTGSRPSTAPPASPSAVPSGTAAPAGCATAAPTSPADYWAQNTVAADTAWPASRGKGQVVAVVDSGVNGGVSRLSGHVLPGADVSSASGRGDRDCLGSGTAMAGLIVAQADQSNSGAGVAPDANVLPIRVVGTTSRAVASQVVAAIKNAVSGNAGIIALGQYVDLTNGDVVAAITDALSHNVLVIVEAPPAVSASSSTNAFSTHGPDLPADDALIRVGGIGADGKQPMAYRSGSVDVVAPAVGVSTVSMSGNGWVSLTGTHLAVAFVAGVAALVRAADPNMDARQVGHVVRTSATKVGDGKVPDPAFGYGMVNAPSAVAAVLGNGAKPAVTPTPVAAGGSGGGAGKWVLLGFVLLLFGAGGYLLVRNFVLRRDGSDDEEWTAQERQQQQRPQPSMLQPAPRPRVAEMAMAMSMAGIAGPETQELYGPRMAESPMASASDWRAARTLAGNEDHWTDEYDESGLRDEPDGDDVSAEIDNRRPPAGDSDRD